MSVSSKDVTYSDDDEDDEIELPITSWGSQTPKQNDSKEESTQGQVSDWKSLIDPDAKITSGLGSGNLHRQGRNYKPVDEDYILAQRKKQPLPKKPSKPKAEKKKVRFDTTSSPSTTPKRDAPTRASRKDPTPPPSSIRSPQKSVWGNANLVEEPFWENTSSGVKTSLDGPAQTQPPRFSRPKNGNRQKQTEKDPWAPPSSTNKNKRLNENKSRPAKIESTSTNNSARWDPSKETTPQARDAGSWKDLPSREPRFDGWDISPEVQAEAAAASASSNSPSQSDGWASSSNWDMGAVSATGWGAPATNAAGASNLSKPSGWSAAPPSTATTALSSSNPPSSTSAPKSNRQFSDAGRRKYSKPIGSGPLPNNYNPNVPVAPPKRVARMPAGENPVILTVNVRLEEETSIPIDIRYYDDPDFLARQFCMRYRIKSNATFTALRELLTDEKKAELQYQNTLKRQAGERATRPFDSHHQQNHRQYQHYQTHHSHHGPSPGPSTAHYTADTHPVNFT